MVVPKCELRWSVVHMSQVLCIRKNTGGSNFSKKSSKMLKIKQMWRFVRRDFISNYWIFQDPMVDT